MEGKRDAMVPRASPVRVAFPIPAHLDNRACLRRAASTWPTTRTAAAMAISDDAILPLPAGWLPIYVAAPLGADLMVLTGCLSMSDAYRHIEWKAVVLIAGMLSLGAAMQHTGAAQLIADGFLGSAAQFGPIAVLAALFLISALAAKVMPTAAVAVLIAPVALDAATALAMNPHAMLMVVAIGSSSAFMSPVGHPVNLMVMGLGGYRFMDYVRVGAPLVLIHFVMALTLVPLLFPLSA